MYREILQILRCPKCNEELALITEKEEDSEIIAGKLKCKNNHCWQISEGVINFQSVEQEQFNNWTESYKEYDYEEMDEKILKGTPKNQKEINEEAKRIIINNINEEENEFILDIATGRGMLFTEMLKELQGKSQILCTDLSFEVLKYDRLKAKKINPKVKVNYIACDATKLPLKDNSIDTATSFFGIANMLNLTLEGIKEANRVLKNGKHFFNAFITIKEDSKGFQSIKQFYKDNNAIEMEKFLLEPAIEKAHSEANFKDIKIITIGESIGEKSELDLIPFEGEWFAVIVVEGIK